MHRLVVISALALLSGCTQEGAPKIPPADRFYFPTAVHHQDGVGTGGRLFVASSNFDGRFDFGSVTAINVDDLALPTFGAPILPECVAPDPAQPLPATCEPKVIHALGTAGAQGSRVLTDSFGAGRFGTLALPGGQTRLFLPTREERDRVHVLDSDPAAASRVECVGAAETPEDCTLASGSPSMTYLELQDQGHPRAIQVVSVAVRQTTGAAYVVHRTPASSELGVSQDLASFTAQIDGFNPMEETTSYHPIGIIPANAIALGQRYGFIVGFSFDPRLSTPLLRLIDLNDPSRILNANLALNVNTLDGRDVAVSSDGTRLYLLSRFPDLLLVLDLIGGTTDSPRVVLVRQVPLPDDPNQLQVLPRGGGRGDVVVITCSQADAVVIYDEDVGALVGQYSDFGRQPYGITADLQGAGARLYISNFADGQLGVLDIPDLNRPEDLRKVAVIGLPQACLMEKTGKACE
ncbi:MAG: hypothetical protein M3Y59_06950 [Myxococcota bacterium]|nr:hypothetical protein [Myxococcota bacterium]